jgi:hypothetical protein
VVGRKVDNLGKRGPLLDAKGAYRMDSGDISPNIKAVQETKRELQIPMYMSSINSGIDDTFKSFNALRDRLDPVLNAEIMSTIDEDVVRFGGPSLAAELEEIKIRLSQLNTGLEKVIVALEL